jgi:hypothetical protein
MRWMLRNSKGEKSATLTFAFVGIVVTSLAMLGSLLSSITVGDVVIKFGEVDSTLALGFLAATVTAYVARRNKTDQIDSDGKNGVVR